MPVPPITGVRVSVGEGTDGVGVVGLGGGVGVTGLGGGVGGGLVSILISDLSTHFLPNPPRFSPTVNVFSATFAVLTDIADVPWP